MPRVPLALLLSAALVLASSAPAAYSLAPDLPAAFTLDGLRDPAYVLVAEDPAGDFVPSPPNTTNFRWADLTRLYLATDADHLYVYVDLPQYTAANSYGEIGLALLLPASANSGPAPDLLRPNSIAYDFSASNQGQCGAEPVSPTRPPDVLIRGHLFGTNGGYDTNDGFTVLVHRTAGQWPVNVVDWGHFGHNDPDRHIDYASTAGVELFIPWSDLGITEPAGVTQLQLAFFTASAAVPGVFDSIPPDPQAPSAGSAVLSRLQTVSLPLPAPQSVALGCDTYLVDEDAVTADIPVQLNTTLTQTVAVSYTATAQTASLADFTAVTGTVTFNPGVTRQTVHIPITDDSLVEEPETLRLTLSSPLALSLAAPVSATITLIDNDTAATEQLLFIPLIRR